MDFGPRTTDHAPRSTLHAPRREHSQRGVALVITLILLSLITFMAITFLVVSRSERGSVTTQTDLTTARLAADAARDRAIAELLAPMMATNNPFNYGLLVSTNYIKLDGFDTGLAGDVRNVNYDYTTKGLPLTPNQQCQNIQNLWLNPRPPVFIATNANSPNGISNDFRFYIDMNRNGAFEPTGLLPLTNALGQPTGSTDFLVGDPQWIGMLQHPDLIHSSTNSFTSRYAYLVVPTGQALDMNTIHNYAKRYLAPGNPNVSWPDGFLRNQGILTAEINLAAFLSDLNTNLWPGYYYNTNLQGRITDASTGAAADDAASVVRYRYGAGLASAANLYGPAGVSAFGADFVDDYSGGPLMTGTWWPPLGPPDADAARVKLPWPGADNPNHFYTTQDLFDRSKFPTAGGGRPAYTFVDRLRMAGTNADSYNRYTFSRLLSQLGTDSAPEPSDKMNLNYCNVDNNGYVVPNAATNFIPWKPIQFFNNAAIRLMVDAGYTVGALNSTSNLLVTNFVSGVLVTNLQIPIWPTNLYTPSLHRLLQLAANLYDATTNRADNGYPATYPYLPTVFRPLFTAPGAGRVGANQISISGYREVTAADTSTLLSTIPPHDLSDPSDNKQVRPTDMVYNVPLVIGAKKGLPNFNEFAAQTFIQVSRKLQYNRSTTNGPIIGLNQMFIVGVSNQFGVEAWNSYAANYPRQLQVYAYPDFSLAITNLETGQWLNRPPLQSIYRQTPPPTTMPINAWKGYSASDTYNLSFMVPLSNNIVFLTNSTFRTPYSSVNPDQFVPLTGTFELTTGTNLHVPHWSVTARSRLRFAVVDAGRIVDYVNLAAQTSLDLTDALMRGTPDHYSPCGPGTTTWTPSYTPGSVWCTNQPDGKTGDRFPTFGILNQIDVSLGHGGSDIWKGAVLDAPPGMSRDAAIAYFKGQFIPSYQAKAKTFNAPFQPYRNIYLVNVWQANDPLVHYTVGDLTDLTGPWTNRFELDNLPSPTPMSSLGNLNGRYEPWGGRPGSGTPLVPPYSVSLKDPVPSSSGRSDYWDFPTNKFANPGWVGRVHRGSPWQTVYLKPPDTNAWTSYWRAWTGNPQFVTNLGQFSTNIILPRIAVYGLPPATTNTNPVVTFTNGLAVFDAYLSQPAGDGHLLDLFSTAFDASATRGRLSINQTNLAAWSAVLSGVIALTNSGVANLGGNSYGIVTPLVISPAGTYDPTAPTNTLPPVVQIVNAINAVRATFPNGAFQRLGDLLSVPQLTVASPFLNLSSSPPNPPLSDAAMERIPQQILGLLKADTVPRFVIYSYGQTLKPAPRSRVTGGAFFGLVTNYQITAEVATRTVVRFDGVQPYQYGVVPSITKLHPVIESFNVLPPD